MSNYMKKAVVAMLPNLAKESDDIESLKVAKEIFIAGLMGGAFPYLSEEEMASLHEETEGLNDKINEYLDIAYEAHKMKQAALNLGLTESVADYVGETAYDATLNIKNGLYPSVVNGSVEWSDIPNDTASLVHMVKDKIKLIESYWDNADVSDMANQSGKALAMLECEEMTQHEMYECIENDYEVAESVEREGLRPVVVGASVVWVA